MQESSLVVWLRRLIYSSTLVPLVIFSQYVSPFHFGKVMVLRTIVEVMAGLYLLLVWRDRSYLPKSNPITWAFLAFTLVFTLTTFTSVAYLQSFWGTLERMGGLFTFWHYFIFYLITVSVLRTKSDWQTLLDLVVCVGLVSALYGFLQRFDISFILGSGGRERIFGTIGNPALFAGYEILVAYLALTLTLMKSFGPATGVPSGSVNRGALYIGGGLLGVIMVALLSSPVQWLGGLWVVPFGVVAYGVYLWIAEAFGGGRIFYGTVAGLTALSAAMTAVRGSLLALVVATMVFALLYYGFKRSKAAKKLFLGLVAGVIVFLFLAILLRNSSLVQNSPYFRRVTDFSLSAGTVQTRLWAWSAGVTGWHDSPKTMLIGWGPENFNVPFSKYFNPKFFTGPGAETFFDRAHNMFVEVLVTMGALGEIAYLSIFVTLFLVLRKLMKGSEDDHLLAIGFISLTIAYIIHNSFIFDTSANFLTFFTILAFATHVAIGGGLASLSAKSSETKSRLASWTAGQQIGAVGIAIGVVILIFATNIQQTQANFASTRATVAGYQGDFVGAVSKSREAIDADVPGRYEYRQRFTQYLLDVSSSPDASKIVTLPQVILQATDDMKANIQENPHDYLPYLYLSRLYITLGRADPASPYNQMALDNSTKALKISPTFVRTYYEVAQAYLNMHQYDKAAATFATAIQLNPNVGTTYWYLGIVDYQRKDYKAALQDIQSAISKGYTLSEQDMAKLINLYLAVNDLKGVTTAYEQLVKDHPDNVQYLTSLAVAYAQAGRTQDAINAVRKAMAINPGDADFQQQANQFLRQLGATP